MKIFKKELKQPIIIEAVIQNPQQAKFMTFTVLLINNINNTGLKIVY